MAEDLTRKDVLAMIQGAFEDRDGETDSLTSRVDELEDRLRDLRRGAEELRGAVAELVDNLEAAQIDGVPSDAVDEYLDEAERLIRLATM